MPVEEILFKGASGKLSPFIDRKKMPKILHLFLRSQKPLKMKKTHFI